MENTSYTQEFYLCAINDKGKIPTLKEPEITLCLMASALMELLDNGYVEEDEKGKYFTVKPWDDALPYLRPMYDTVSSAKKPISANSIADNYLVSNKDLVALLQSIGASLAEFDCATELPEQGFKKNKTLYAPNSGCTKNVIEKIRAEFLEDGPISYEAVCLGVLLEKSGLVRDYFSKVESGELKARLKQLRDSEAYKTATKFTDIIGALVAMFA